MNTMCPCIVNQRLSTKKIIKWFKIHRLELLVHIESKQLTFAPPCLYWASLLAMQHFTSHIIVAFHSIQGLTTLLEQQQATSNDLVASFIDNVGMTGPLTTESIGNLDTSTHVINGLMSSLYQVSNSFYMVWLLGWTH
jgi:mannose/fructose/N-acetylgalactosamine-specific phosphotransferase system component IID